MTRKQIESVIEQLMNWTLIISGAFGSALGIINLVSNSQPDQIKSSSLLLLGLIALGLGLERLITYKRFERTIENLAGGIRLDSWDEIYVAASELVQSAKFQIRATAFSQDKWAGPTKYLELTAKKAKFLKNSKRDFLYKVVFGYTGNPSSYFAKHILLRSNIFERYGVRDMLRMKRIETKWGADFLIVDNHSLIIAFPQYKSQNLRVGIKFVNQPQLIEPITIWYDEQIWAVGKDMNIDLNEIRKFSKEKH